MDGSKTIQVQVDVDAYYVGFPDWHRKTILERPLQPAIHLTMEMEMRLTCP